MGQHDIGDEDPEREAQEQEEERAERIEESSAAGARQGGGEYIVGPVTGPTGTQPALTFFFPAYNEEANIERTVIRALEDIGPLVSSIEVVAIDDGSTDATPLADELAAADPRVRVVHQPNRGYGGR